MRYCHSRARYFPTPQSNPQLRSVIYIPSPLRKESRGVLSALSLANVHPSRLYTICIQNWRMTLLPPRFKIRYLRGSLQAAFGRFITPTSRAIDESVDLVDEILNPNVEGASRRRLVFQVCRASIFAGSSFTSSRGFSYFRR